MSFHFDISPPAKPMRPPAIKVTTIEETPCLSLTCFAPNIKLDFENVVVGTTSTQQILIKNPSEHTIMVSVVNLPPAEQGVTLNWSNKLISCMDAAVLEISWRPLLVDSWRHTFKLEDGQRIRKSITVVFKSISVSKKPLKPKNTSIPLHRKSRSSPKPRKSSTFFTKKVSNKENSNPNCESFVITSNNTFTIKHHDDQVRRETYTINEIKPIQETCLNISMKHNKTFTIDHISICTEKSFSKDFSDDSIEIEAVHKQISFLLNSSPLVTPDKQTFDHCSLSCSSTKKKTFPLFETPIKEESNILNQSIKLKRKSNSTIEISPPKRLQLSESCNRISNVRIKQRQLKKCSVNPYLLSVDPFLSSPIYTNHQWMIEQEERFKKWLNCLVMPPAELHSNTEVPTVDVAKLWQDCKNKPDEIPLTKELASSNYHTNKHLDMLRINASEIYKSSEMTKVLRSINNLIDTEKLSMRIDRNIHANLGLQFEVVKLLFCYNPLWLRIGLETIFDIKIPLASNSDIIGLTHFIKQRLFKDATLLKKHKSIYTPKYIIAIKQFALKQFLSLVYFLDVAKTKVLIPHNPCLFCKNAQYKETREILFAFARELLAAVGDITRFLKRFGYIVVHEQKYIHEFDYSVIHLGSDLQDGIRLTKIMEIILVQAGLIEKLRVPAISKLQKIHNVEIAFTALANANFTIVGDITPKDIVEGHREKTLSFLWQIIYKFQAPILIKAATKIQHWWRSFPISIKRRILIKPHIAATKIQQSYRLYQMMKKQRTSFLKIKAATIIIQQWFRHKRQEKAAIIIQRWYKAQTSMRVAHAFYISLKAAALYIQRYFRAQKEVKFSQIRKAAIVIQQRFRANKLMKIDRLRFLALKQATVKMQRLYRATQTMHIVQRNYISLRTMALLMQQRFRANRATKFEHSQYLSLKHAAVKIQQRFRANQIAKVFFENYCTLKAVVITIQRRFRANIAMKCERSAFIALKISVLAVQQRFKANIAMQHARYEYLAIKKASIVIQRKFRANRSRDIVRKEYCTLQKAAVLVQRHFRAMQMMKCNRLSYISMRHSALLIQRRFQANRAMKQKRSEYLSLRIAAITIQCHFRANQKKKVCYASYQMLKKSAVIIQRRFRANQEMKQKRLAFITYKVNVIKIQQRFKANLAMEMQRAVYQKMRGSVILIQERFRSKKIMEFERGNFICLKRAALVIQLRFRANREMKRCLFEYQRLKAAALRIQQSFRATKKMLEDRTRFQCLKRSVITIQRIYKANLIMGVVCKKYTTIKSATLVIQNYYRAHMAMKYQRTNYLKLKNAAIVLQRRFKANLIMHQYSVFYQLLRNATITIQQHYKAFRLGKNQRFSFTLLKQTTITIQQRYRANLAMKPIRQQFKKMQQATITVQRHFRANRAMKIECQKYTTLKQSAVVIQRCYRKYMLIAGDRLKFIRYRNMRKAAAVKIQAVWRGYCTRKNHPEMSKIRNNSKQVNLVAEPQNTLRARKEQALLLLQSDNASLLAIIYALGDIDFITRRSKQTCLDLSELLPDILYLIIRAGNRSLPDMQACAAATGILINFYKYPPSSLSAWVPDHIENIFTILIHCCDKEDKLFLYLSTLVWLFAHNEQYRAVICNIPNFSLIVNKMKWLCLRKQKMVLQQRNCNYMSIFMPFQQLPLPSCTPDWGLEYPDHPRLFTNSMHALKCLIEILDCK